MLLLPPVRHAICRHALAQSANKPAPVQLRLPQRLQVFSILSTTHPLPTPPQCLQTMRSFGVQSGLRRTRAAAAQGFHRQALQEDHCLAAGQAPDGWAVFT